MSDPGVGAVDDLEFFMGLPEKKPSKHSSIRFVQQPNAKERQLERLMQKQAALSQQIEKLQSR